MSKNRVVVLFLAMCLILGTVPFALGATTQTTSAVIPKYVHKTLVFDLSVD